jgi:hypothetical protein
MIYKDDELLEGYLILLNNQYKLPYINQDMNINNYVNKYMKIDKIRELLIERYYINDKTYIIYYAIGNSKYYNSIYDLSYTDYIWKDNYIIKCNRSSSNIYKINDFAINSMELVDKYKKLLFNI